MITRYEDEPFRIEAVLPAERVRLVRLCGHLSGDWGAAEDLAQETLIEAWRHAGKLRDPRGYDRWLSAIARNVCRRGARSWERERAHVARSGVSDDATADLTDGCAADADLDIALERGELADLLDRAMALLPPEMRAALVARYIEESPQAEIAARLGVTEGALAVRLHRGKLALRRLLETDLRDEAAAYGLVDGSPDGWTETRIWCPRCGRCRLRAWLDRDPERGAFILRCPRCYPNEREGLNTVCTHFAHSPDRVPLLASVKGWRPMLSRTMADTHQYYRQGFARGLVSCMKCGRPTPIRYWWQAASALHPALRGVAVRCDHCRLDPPPNESLDGLALNLPEGRRFWREHPRIRALPEREIEAAGVPAIVTTYESVTDGARYTVVSARDTFAVIRIDGVAADDACTG